MFKGLRDSLTKFSHKAKETVSEKEVSLKDLEEPLENLKMQLIKNNVSFDVSEKIIEDLTEKLEGTKIARGSLVEFLKKAIRIGYKNIIEWVANDPDFEAYRDDPQFKEILAKAGENI